MHLVLEFIEVTVNGRRGVVLGRLPSVLLGEIGGVFLVLLFMVWDSVLRNNRLSSPCIPYLLSLPLAHSICCILRTLISQQHFLLQRGLILTPNVFLIGFLIGVVFDRGRS